MTSGTRPTDGSSQVSPHAWTSTLRDAASHKVLLGKTTDNREIKHYKTAEEMTAHGAYEASITDIYDYSKNIFEKSKPQEKQEIAKHLATIIDIKSAKAEDTIKEMSATWITALKVFLAATVILIPVAAYVHSKQAETIGTAEKELQEIKDLKGKATELTSFIKGNLGLQEKKQVYTQEINDIVDVMNHKKEPKDIKLAKKDSLEILKSKYAVDNNTFVSNVKSKYIENIQKVPVSNIVVLNETKKDRPNIQEASDAVTYLNEALGADAARWARPIQGLCVQDTLLDMRALQVSSNGWRDTNGVSHDLEIKYPSSSFNILITRSTTDPDKIEKVTISLDTPIALTHHTDRYKANQKQAEEEFDHSLTYHLSMEVTLDAQNEPQINVLRREFTKEGKV